MEMHVAHDKKICIFELKAVDEEKMTTVRLEVVFF